MSDEEKLLALAAWFDVRDRHEPGEFPRNEVQRDLRRIAAVIGELDSLRSQLSAMQRERDEARSQCCMCGKKGLSLEEDGGPECELTDGRWVCSSMCWDFAVGEMEGHNVGTLAEVTKLAAERDAALAHAEALAKALGKFSGHPAFAGLGRAALSAFRKEHPEPALAGRLW